MFSGKSYFNIQPLNNVSSFSPVDGQDVIRFSIPPMANALLDDVVFSGNLQINIDANTVYNIDDILDNNNSEEIGVDSVIGIHNFISKCELSTRRGNIQLETRNNYDLISKTLSSPYTSSNDLNYGLDCNMNICSPVVRGSMRRLIRGPEGDATIDTTPDGSPFSVRLNVGMLTDAQQKIALDKLGGLEIIISLASVQNALMNVDNTFTNLLGGGTLADVRYTLRNVKLFGVYQMYNPSMGSQLTGLNFKQINNNLQVLNSSNDVNGFTPMVASLDHILCVSQPNTSSKNNFATNSVQCNEVIGQQNYRTSKSGMPFPMDYKIENTTAIPNLPTTQPLGDNLTSGSAEATYHLCLCTNNKYPVYHSLMTMDNEATTNEDLSVPKNEVSTNFAPIGVGYQYGFDGYSSNFMSDLVQIQITSAIKTTQFVGGSANLNDIRGQAQTFNNLFKYNSQLNYANLMVSK